MESIKLLWYLVADSVKNMSKVTLKSYFLTEIFLQKKEMSSFVL